MEFFKTYIVPIIMIISLSGVFAFLLAFLSEKLRVKHNENIDKIRENLAGANCGGCGYAGCDAFAEALFKGETTIDKCRPTKKKYKDVIAEILGTSVKESDERVAVVRCNGGNDAANKGGYQGYGDCESANLLSGGRKVCETACMGLGSCVNECPNSAISIDKNSGVAVVDPAFCTDCGACISTCPKSIIGEIPSNASVYVACRNKCAGRVAVSQCKHSCIACGQCVKVCRSNAIKIVQNIAKIDYKKCFQCGLCVKACPRSVIKDRTQANTKKVKTKH